MLVGLLVGAVLAAACARLAWASVPEDAAVVGAFERALEVVLAEESTDAARASMLDELLADVERDLEGRSQWAAVAMRLALFGGGAASLALGFESGVRVALALLPGVALGLALAWRSLGHRARAVDRIRRRIDEVVGSLASDLLSVPLPASRLSTRRHRRSGRR